MTICRYMKPFFFLVHSPCVHNYQPFLGPDFEDKTPNDEPTTKELNMVETISPRNMYGIVCAYLRPDKLIWTEPECVKNSDIKNCSERRILDHYFLWTKQCFVSVDYKVLSDCGRFCQVDYWGQRWLSSPWADKVEAFNQILICFFPTWLIKTSINGVLSFLESSPALHKHVKTNSDLSSVEMR